MDEALASDLHHFRSRYPFDDDAYNYIVNSSIEVQHEVLRDFKPRQEGEEDYSALIMGFTKKRRQSVKERQLNSFSGAARAHFYEPSFDEQDVSLTEAELQAFRDRYPFDEDYSALVISFAKRCRNVVPSRDLSSNRGPSGREYEAFRDRYPFDDDTHNYLQSSPPEVRRHVLQSFKPPREGEADYSALLISFCKKIRDQRVPQLGRGFQAPRSLSAPGYQPPRQQPPWRQPHQPPPPPPPPRFRGARASHVDGFQRSRDESALGMFRQRYPMDDRAFDFLKSAQPWVQQEVLENFAPQRLDSDYSALVIAFAKKCRERDQAGGLDTKRPRLAY